MGTRHDEGRQTWLKKEREREGMSHDKRKSKIREDTTIKSREAMSNEKVLTVTIKF